jgi:hypothetical protein
MTLLDYRTHVAVLGAIVLMLVGMHFLGIPPIGDNEDEQLATAVCQDTFGDEWHGGGYSMGANPPVVYCSGPDGQRGVVDMPPSMQDELGIVTAERYNQSG